MHGVFFFADTVYKGFVQCCKWESIAKYGKQALQSITGRRCDIFCE